MKKKTVKKEPKKTVKKTQKKTNESKSNTSQQYRLNDSIDVTFDE
jgi:hypothetical protein